MQFSRKVSTLFNSHGMSKSTKFNYHHKYLKEKVEESAKASGISFCTSLVL